MKIFLQSGKLMVGEFPEEPKWAVEVVDFKDSDIFFEEGKLYDIREGWTVEIDTIETLPPKYEARLIPVKEQTSSIAATGVPEPDYTNFTPKETTAPSVLADIELVMKTAHNAAIDKALTAMKIEWREDRHEIYNAIAKLKI